MPQSVLDPRSTAGQGIWKPDGPLPRKVREFGRYPNVPDWLPGDLWLFHTLGKGAFVSNLIIRAQAFDFSVEHARWHHAAVYVGDGFLCEAGVVRGVQYRSVNRYIGGHCIRVRRDPSLSTDERYNIAIRTLTRIKETYGIWTALGLGLKTLGGFRHPSKLVLHSQGVICSRLYELAYMAATKRVLATAPDRPILPAELSLTGVLHDVPVHWLEIAKI